MEEKPNYYAIIPANVRYDTKLNANCKLLYGEITSLSNKYGYCIATNDYFSNLYSVSPRTITEWIKSLESLSYIYSEIETKRYEDGTIKKIRKLYINHIEDSQHHHIEVSLQNHIEENFLYNNKENNNKDINIIVDYLNEKTSSSYKSSTRSTKDKILARLNEGFSVEDFKKVIDNKCNDWIGTDYAKFLRPETLFGTKFESYLNQKPREEKTPGWFKQEMKEKEIDDETRRLIEEIEGT